jgi:hypothetical protein
MSFASRRKSPVALFLPWFCVIGIGSPVIASAGSSHIGPQTISFLEVSSDWSKKKDEKKPEQPIRRIPKGPLLIGPDFIQPRDKPKQEKPQKQST